MYTIDQVEKLVDEALDRALDMYQTNRLYEAEILLNQVLIHFDSESLRALQLQGLVLHRQKKYEEAIEIFTKALELDSGNSENHNNLSLCYANIGDYDNSFKHVDTAIELNPDNHLYYNNRGHQFRMINDFDNAMNMFKKANEVKSDDPYILHNIGGCYMEMKDLDNAIPYLEKSAESHAAAKVDLAYAYQAVGRWKEAWEMYESRLEHFAQVQYFKKRYAPEKLWTGQDLKNKTIVLYCEQGIGDLIQFFRFVPRIKPFGINVKVVIEAPKSIHNLLKANGFKVLEDASAVSYNYHCSIMSLPHYIGMNPILKHSRLNPFKEASLGDYKDTFNIGIAWAGNPQHPRDRQRSVFLNQFKPIHDIPGVKLFSLQKDSRKRIWPPSKDPIDLTEGASDMSIVDMSSFLNDFQDTAAIIEELDLVITVDTAILHLASALGKDTFGLVSYLSDTRWGLEGEDTIWHTNHLKLFRQPKRDDWDSVFEKAKRRVTRLLEDNTKLKSS